MIKLKKNLKIIYLFLFLFSNMTSGYAEMSEDEIEKEAKAGNVAAQTVLGTFYEAENDFENAIKWYTLAAEEGDINAQMLLASIYQGHVKEYKNDKKATKWFTRAADQGNALAQRILAARLENGTGVIQNYEYALSLYQLSAAQGEEMANVRLALAYYLGESAELMGAKNDPLGKITGKDNKKARKFAQISAEKGNKVAIGLLGLFYFEGIGTTQDFVKAHMWSNLAASEGQELGIYVRDKVAKNMTNEDISKAQKMAVDCLKKNYKGC